MTYELAKALKDAGFPQDKTDFVWRHWRHNGELIVDKRQDEWHDYPRYRKMSPVKVFVANPTLSELIEACEPGKTDEFGLNTKSNVWEAFLTYHGYCDYPEKFKDADGMANLSLSLLGTTPEEAVARLWLALNNHDKE